MINVYCLVFAVYAPCDGLLWLFWYKDKGTTTKRLKTASARSYPFSMVSARV